jgi:hypothetical protein
MHAAHRYGFMGRSAATLTVRQLRLQPLSYRRAPSLTIVGLRVQLGTLLAKPAIALGEDLLHLCHVLGAPGA